MASILVAVASILVAVAGEMQVLQLKKQKHSKRKRESLSEEQTLKMFLLVKSKT